MKRCILVIINKCFSLVKGLYFRKEFGKDSKVNRKHKQLIVLQNTLIFKYFFFLQNHFKHIATKSWYLMSDHL